MKLQLKKLNMEGMSHLIVPLAIVVVAGAFGTYYFVNSHAASVYPCKNHTFSQGSSGTCVVDIQKIVRDFGTNEPNAGYFKYSSRSVLVPRSFLDGSYGPNTAGQVKNFQHWFPNTGTAVDGVVGPHTWGLICNGNGQSIARQYYGNNTYHQVCG
jgi:peptidoglycan hydrolase-like protein with peptidoglycan-binding domain